MAIGRQRSNDSGARLARFHGAPRDRGLDDMTTSRFYFVTRWWQAFALAGLIPLIAANLFLSHMLSSLETQSIQGDIRRHSVAAATAVKQVVTEQLSLAMTVGASPLLDYGDTARFHILAKRAADAHPDWSELILSDAHGPLVDTHTPPGKPVAPVVDSESWSQVWKTGLPSIGNYANGQIAIQEPVIRDGTVRYAVTVLLRPAVLSQALRAVALPPQWRASVTDRNMIIIGRTENAGKAIGSTASVAYVAEREAGSDTVTNGTLADGTPAYVIVLPVQGTPWNVAVLAPVAAVAAPYRSIELPIDIATVLLAMVAIAFTAMTLLRIKRVTDERARHLERELLAAETLSRDKSGLLNGMNHELRAPLNAITGFAQLIQKIDPNKPTPEFIRAYAGNIESSATHLLTLINDMLDLAKIESGKMALTESDVDIANGMRLVDRMMREQAHRAGVALTLDPGDMAVTARVDEMKIKQCVLNLVSNAIKFTPPGGSVRFSLGLAADGARITVADTGIGIKPEDISKVFNEFEQIDSHQGMKSKGTGLGLPLAKKFIEMHGGTIGVASAPGSGTTMTLFLPAARILASERIRDVTLTEAAA